METTPKGFERVVRAKKVIVRRETVAGKVQRVLACGHTVPEPRGGKAKLATTSRCKQCNPPKLVVV